MGAKTWKLTLEGLTKSYSDNILFQDLNIELRPGMAIHVQGPNGSGKTQLMLVIAGLVEPDAGRILFRGSSEVLVNRLSPETRAQFARYIPYLPGHLAEMSVDRALLVLTRHLRPFSLHNQSAAASRVASELEPELRVICGRKVEFDRPLAQYSLGEQKRIMTMASMRLNPYPILVMLDEPLAGLDRQGIARTLDLMGEARARGIALLVSEHRPEISSVGFDQVLRLPYCPNQNARVELMTTVPPQSTTLSTASAEPVLRVSEALAGYTGSLVYCSSLTVAPGELVLIEGPNGSGKTSFVRGLLGHPGTVLSGRVEFENCPRANLKSVQQTSAIRYLSQGRDLFPDLTVRESIVVAGRGRLSIEDTDDIVRFLGPSKRVRHLSSGGRALLGLAQAVAGAPSLMILDEPAANTDADNRRRIWGLIERIRLRGLTAILVIEHGAVPISASAVYQVRQGDSSGPAALMRV